MTTYGFGDEVLLRARIVGRKTNGDHIAVFPGREGVSGTLHLLVKDEDTAPATYDEAVKRITLMTPLGVESARQVLSSSLEIQEHINSTPKVEKEEGELRIENGWLVRCLNRCTCSPYGSAHEPHCGVEPELNLSTLPGWDQIGKEQ